MLNYLYLDLNSFFASCEQQEHPELRGKPMAIVPMLADTTFCLAASYPAKAFGVKTGTRVADAKRMCPQLKLVVARHRLYVEYHHRIKKAVEQCVPIHSVLSVDEFCCQLTGSQRDPMKAMALAQSIRKRIAEDVGEALTCSFGIASNVLLAKMASDMQKPNGLTVLEPSQARAKLESLPLRDVPGIGPRMEARIRDKGISTLKELLSLNELQMRGIWGGVVGARYYHLLKGEDLPYWFKSDAQKSIGHEHVLAPQQRTRTGALLSMKNLLAKAAIRLRKNGAMAKKLGVQLKTVRGEKMYRELSFHETQSTSILFKHLNNLYSQIKFQDRPLKVGVVLSGLVSAKTYQLSLFDSDRPNHMFKAVDELNNRFGKDTVYLGSLHDTREASSARIAFSRIPDVDE